MGISIEIKTPGAPKIDAFMRRIAPATRRRIFERGLTFSVLEMQAEVTSSGDFIVHGRGDADPLPDKLTSRHGGSGLVGSIAPDYTGLPREARLGSDLAYAGVHEDSRRAYLLPTYDKMAARDRFAEIMIAVAEEELELR